MSSSSRSRRSVRRRVAFVPALAGLLCLTAQAPAFAGPASRPHGYVLSPGNLLVSTSVYQDDPDIIAGETALPPGCVNPSPTNANCEVAVTSGTYPYVFNNDTVDASFGVTSKIVLEELAPSGVRVGQIVVPNSGEPGVSANDDQMVTSFSSKSELALNLSTNGRYVTFLGYNAPVDTADVSNSSTPGAYDPTNPVIFPYYRVVAELGRNGTFHFTETDAFSGDNGRAAILNDEGGADVVYAAGNAGNGANPEPEGVVVGAGAQLISPSAQPEAEQSPGQPTPVGSFNAPVELGAATQKVAKDDNYRGIAVYDNVLYYTKGSGSNGVDTVYFVDTSGKACPDGVGVPQPGAALPTTSTLSYDASEGGTGNPGLTPQNMCILKGFPTAPAKSATDASDYPFGVWFANPDTLYVADEGSGDNTYSATNGDYGAAAASATAGLQKWVFNTAAGQWQLAYTLQSGLNLGRPYQVPGYPTGDNSGPGGSGLPWSPATDGLRALTGRVNPNGTVTIWAVTSTVSGSGDQGADPDKLVEISDNLGATTTPAHERFATLETAPAGAVLRGVSFTPGT
jgi:hypothetical protein